MRKICALTANRADFSRMETILKAIKARPDLELQLVVMGSHLLEKSGHTAEEIKKKGFDIDHSIYMEVAGGNPTAMTKSVGLAIMELSTALDRLKPDVVIVPVDRFESMAMGVAAALMNIHVAHIQGGEVTGTIDESIRHALTKMSHLHFVATEKSKDRVIKMGEREDAVFNVGCPATDLLLAAPVWDRAETINALNKQIKTGAVLDPNKPYFLVMQHPVTTEFGSASKQMEETLEALKKFDHQAVIFWPNIDAGANEISRIIHKYTVASSAKMQAVAHLSSELFANVLRNADCQLGNSSSGIREACYFGVPVVNIGSRQNDRERGANVINAGYNRKEISDAIQRQIKQGRYKAEHLYGDGTAGKKIAELLATVPLPNIQKKITY